MVFNPRTALELRALIARVTREFVNKPTLAQVLPCELTGNLLNILFDHPEHMFTAIGTAKWPDGVTHANVFPPTDKGKCEVNIQLFGYVHHTWIEKFMNLVPVGLQLNHLESVIQIFLEQSSNSPTRQKIICLALLTYLSFVESRELLSQLQLNFRTFSVCGLFFKQL